MEVSRHQFAQKLPTIQQAIKECDFIAIDTELSGLHRPNRPIRLYNMDDRYQEYKEATERFIIIQFGLCTFHWDEASARYISKPFNFYIFPTSITGHIQTNRVFSTQAQAFDFLQKQSFDFNKWVYQGIPYMTKDEEVEFVGKATRILNDEIPDIPVDSKEAAWLEKSVENIKEFAEVSKDDFMFINTKNAYQRRLLYQEIRKFESLTAQGVQGAIKLMKLNKKQLEERNKEKMEKFEKDCIAAIGFRKVIDMISESKKPVVGHNMLLDICHVIHQFVEPLPETLKEFKTLAHQVFPTMIDTKYMCASQPELYSIFGTGTALENLKAETNKEQFKNPHIDFNAEFPRYITEMAHEAGYDAYMTGFVFLKLTAYLDKVRNPAKYDAIEAQRLREEEIKQRELEQKKEPRVDADGWEISDEEDDTNAGWDDDEEEVFNYGSVRVDLKNDTLSSVKNKTALVRTAFTCFDFVQPQTVSKKADGIHVAYPPGTVFTKQEANDLFAQYGKHIIEVIDDTSSFVIFEDFVGNINDIKLNNNKDWKITSVEAYLE